MFTSLVLASAMGLSGQLVAVGHVRTSEPRILAIVEYGLDHSATFRRLVETLNASDVIVYVEPKLSHRGLGGYLAHRVVVAGDVRYLKIGVNMHGGDFRMVALVAHELQHAVEVAQAPAVRDTASLVHLFERSLVSTVCGGCYETEAALDVQEAVLAELKVSKPTTELIRRAGVL